MDIRASSTQEKRYAGDWCAESAARISIPEPFELVDEHLRLAKRRCRICEVRLLLVVLLKARSLNNLISEQFLFELSCSFLFILFRGFAFFRPPNKRNKQEEEEQDEQDEHFGTSQFSQCLI